MIRIKAHKRKGRIVKAHTRYLRFAKPGVKKKKKKTKGVQNAPVRIITIPSKPKSSGGVTMAGSYKNA